jgi:hypothetical protein
MWCKGIHRKDWGLGCRAQNGTNLTPFSIAA